MSLGSEYSRSISDLELRRGQITANAKRERGQLLGNTLASLSQLPQAIMQQREQERAKQVKEQANQTDQQLRQAELDIRRQQLTQKADPLDAEKKQLELNLAKHEAVARQLVNANAENWHARRVIAGTLLGTELPEEYPGDETIKGWVDEGQTVASQLEAQRKAIEAAIPKEKPLIPVPDPNNPGKAIYGTPQAGQPVYEKPPSAGSTPNVGSFEDYVTRTYGGNPTPEQVIAGRKAYNQADDRPRVDVNVSGSNGGLDPDAVEYTATQYRVLGPSGIPTRIETPDRVKILNTAAKQAKQLGQTPAQAVQKQAAFKSDAASLTQMQKMRSSAEAFESKAATQADLVDELSQKVGRSKFPILNAALLAGKQSIAGDTDTQLLFNALTTFTSEYAKIMEGSTGSAAGSSDAARKAASTLISPALAKGTLSATVEQMKKEMRWTIAGYDATIGHITDRMGGSAQQPGQGPAVAPSPTSGIPSYQDYLKSKGAK